MARRHSGLGPHGSWPGLVPVLGCPLRPAVQCAFFWASRLLGILLSPALLGAHFSGLVFPLPFPTVVLLTLCPASGQEPKHSPPPLPRLPFSQDFPLIYPSIPSFPPPSPSSFLPFPFLLILLILLTSLRTHFHVGRVSRLYSLFCVVVCAAIHRVLLIIFWQTTSVAPPTN